MAVRFYVPLGASDIKRFYHDWGMTAMQGKNGVQIDIEKTKKADEVSFFVVIEVHQNKEAADVIRNSLFGEQGVLTIRGWHAQENVPYPAH